MKTEQALELEIIESKISKLIARRNALYRGDNAQKNYSEVTKHLLNTEGAYAEQGKNARQYKTFHILSNSSYTDKVAPFYDFPEEEYSIEKFITKLEQKNSDSK